jgi:CBS domain-containing protein
LAQLDQPFGHDPVESCLLCHRVAALKPRRPATIAESATLQDALRAMIDENIGAVLVVSGDGRLRGILSERDLLMRAVDFATNGISGRPAVEFMTADPESVTVDDTLAKALHKMDVGRYRHLPVMDAGMPVGIIAVQDLVRHITQLCKELK